MLILSIQKKERQTKQRFNAYQKWQNFFLLFFLFLKKLYIFYYFSCFFSSSSQLIHFYSCLTKPYQYFSTTLYKKSTFGGKKVSPPILSSTVKQWVFVSSLPLYSQNTLQKSFFTQKNVDQATIISPEIILRSTNWGQRGSETLKAKAKKTERLFGERLQQNSAKPTSVLNLQSKNKK